MSAGRYGWNEAGNCLWCGESGRCQCDHSRACEQAARELAQAGRVAEALRAFPVAPQHNLCSTASEEERTAYITAVMAWWQAEGWPATVSVAPRQLDLFGGAR